MKKINSKNSISFRKAVKIFRSFDFGQRDKFDSFLKSKFFDISVEVKLIFQLMKKNMRNPDFIGFKKIELENLFDEKNNGEKYDPKIAMEVNETIEKFLVLNEIGNHKFSQQHLLLKAYQNQGLSDLFDKTATQTIAQIKKGKTYDHDFHLKNFLIQETIYLNPNTEKHALNIPSQSEMIKSLDAFFYMVKLRLGIELSQRKNFISKSTAIFGINDALVFANKNESPHFKFYALLLNLVKEDQFQEKKFKKVKDTFEREIDLWSDADQRQLLQFLINYLTSFMNKNNPVARTLQLELFNLRLDKNLFIENNNTITDISFLNMVIVFTNFKEYKKAEKIILEYQKYLPSKTRKSTVQNCEAYLAMSKEDFKSAIKILQTINENSDLFKLFTRCYLLRSSFEQFLIDPTYQGVLKATIASMSNHLKKNKTITADRKKSYKNLCDIVQKIYKIYQIKKLKNNQSENIKALEQKVSNVKYPIPMKPWVLEKIQNL